MRSPKTMAFRIRYVHPYSRKWLSRFKEVGLTQYPSEDHLDALAEETQPQNALEKLGFSPFCCGSTQCITSIKKLFGNMKTPEISQH